MTGTLLGPTGQVVKNGTLQFQLSQVGLLIGSGNIAATTGSCYTSSDGTIVGVPNPLALPTVSVNYGTGTLPAGTYYVQIAYYTAGSTATLPSPEAVVQLTSQGSFAIAPTTLPPGAIGFIGYASTTSGAEVSQGQTSTPTSALSITAPLQSAPPGVLPVGSNNTICTVAFNDTIIPYTGYNVSLLSSSGNAYPGWPQEWQLNGGQNGVVNVSQGAPRWNGVTVYPNPIVAQPLNHGPQSIAGNLNMTGYNLLNVGAIGIGTSTPAYPLDVENGLINTNLGYLIGGQAPLNHYLCGNGTAYVDSATDCAGSTQSLYYQHMQNTGSLQAQEPYLNFSGNFALADNPGSTRTEVDLARTSVTAGTYTNPTITVDAYGRVQAASTPTSSLPSQIQPIVVNSGFCTTGTSAYASCPTTVTWPVAFANTSYAITCSPGPLSAGVVASLSVSNKTTTGFTLTTQNGSGSGAVATTLAEADCVGTHP